jgi:penicillin-binding protein 1A
MIKKLLKNRKLRRIGLIGIGIIIVTVLGVFLGVFFTYQKGLPRIKNLEDIKPSVVSEVYSDDGRVIGRYFLEKRIILTSKEIPDVIKKAFIATEDSRFYKHWGVDFWRVLGAFVRNIKHGRKVQGASTITMQLARSLFLTQKRTWSRKIKETFLSFQIERQYTKDQILTYYLNQIYLGYGNYGVEAASEFYFGKKAKYLSIDEAALLAGINSSVGRYSPLTHKDRAIKRRNYALKRMLDEKFISKKQYLESKTKPLNIVKKDPYQNNDYLAYFIEEVRKYISSHYGSKVLYQNGLKVYTTLNMEYQKIAYKALRAGLRAHDKRKGWRKDKKNVLSEGKKIEEIILKEWKLPPREGYITKGVVIKVSSKIAKLKIGEYTGILKLENAKWTKIYNMRKIVRKGDIIEVRVLKKDEKTKTVELYLEQEPKTEGGFLAINPHTGEIKAMIGGYSFKRSEFNNAVQAKRQPGSTFKPIIYSAALSNGYTPASTFIDEPVTFNDKWTGEEWSPLNFDQKYRGLCTLRRGLEESRNVITAKLLEAITPQLAIEYAKRFGIKSKLKPYLSMSLGTMEVSLLEMVSAFTVFPNHGVRIKPFFIKKIQDMNENILYENRFEANQVITPQVAYQMTYMLEGVVQRGTAGKARVLKLTCGGKTGTTDDYTDAWFIGFTPSVVAGVWVGYDHKKSLGNYETGSRAALPVWMDFMRNIYKDKPAEDFQVPPNISFVKIDYFTGLLATPSCRIIIDEAFVPGTEPQKFCREEDHLLVNDYYTHGLKGNEEE